MYHRNYEHTPGQKNIQHDICCGATMLGTSTDRDDIVADSKMRFTTKQNVGIASNGCWAFIFTELGFFYMIPCQQKEELSTLKRHYRPAREASKL